MPKADDMPLEAEIVKLLFAGPSGSGKTTSLASLIDAGYKVRLVDLDAGWKILYRYVKQKFPEKMDGLSVISYRDKLKATAQGVVVSGTPTAFIDTMNALDKWPDDDSDPAEWGPEYVLVIDSLTRLSRAAYYWFDKLNPHVKDKRQIFFQAQDAVLKILENLTAESFNTNVIVCAHLEPNKTETKFHPKAIGKAIGPEIPTLFNNYVKAESKGAGNTAVRTLRTMSDGLTDLKNENPFEIDRELPLETGLATLFEQLKGN